MAQAQAYIDSILKGSYAEGIEAGEITETGPVMVHGTDENPEYILNSDQTGQLLENLATQNLSGDNGVVGNATASTVDESTASTGVTGNARTVLEGVNKVISQISSMINQEALTNSNLIQIVEILRELKESQGLLYEVVNADYSADQTHFDTLMAWLQEQLDKLIGYLDGYNEKLDAGNATLGEILDGVNQGIEAISGLVDAINSLASQVASIGSVGVGNVGTSVGSGSSGSSNGNYYYYSKDYLSDALTFAKQGDEKAAMNALWNRGQKVNLTGEDYGTNASEALKRVQEALKNSGYAEGIEEGPITDTGLTMVHGSNESPEYILNSDQAGQMLENLSTQDMSNVDSRTSGTGSATTSTTDAGTSTIGVTGNARTTLEGINKIITQISGVINQEALTTSQLIQAVSILRSLKESQDLLYQIMNTDVTNDEARFNELKEYLDTVIQKLWEYLDGYNEKLDTGNATLSDILEQAQLGVEAINNLAEGIQGLMNTMSAMQDQLDSISVGGVGSTVGGGSGSSSKGFDFSKDYLGIAIDAAKRGDVDAMNQALADRNYKVSVTGQNYGTNSSDAQKKAESYLPGYAEGIENGPVTTTGPAMLHGSESSPEYVLNSDQAGNLLENMATTEPPINGNTDSGLVDDSLATGGLTEGGLTEGEAKDKERNGDTSGTREANAEDSLFGEAGASVTGSANTVLQGINKIITQISAMINQQALTNSQLTQAVVLLQGLRELETSVSTLLTTEFETNAERYETLMELLNNTIETWSENINSILENQATGLEGQAQTNDYMLNMLDLMTQGTDYLEQMASAIASGVSGDWYMTSESGGKFSGNFGGGKGGSGSSSYDDEEGGSGGGAPNKNDYQTGWWEEGHDYLGEAIEAAKKGDTEGAYELLKRRGYKILDTGDNKGTTQAEAVEKVKDALEKAGASTVSSLGDSGIYDADRYLEDVSDYNSSKSSSSSGGGASRPNYGGYDSADDFDNAIHDAFDKAVSSGQNVTIGNSGLYIDASKLKGKSYSSGIENGPVTYTGMAMLHGTPSSPEFVLNSDQAYNLLRNMATANATEFETEGNGSEGVSYILYGDVNLKTDTSPAKFWSAVSAQMQSRWNTSKHNVK